MLKADKHPLYHLMSAAEIQLISSIEVIQNYESGELLIQTNQRNRDLICINRGKVSIRIELTGGSAQEVSQLESGNLIGEMNFVIPTRRTADVIALTEVEVSIYPYQELTALLRQNPALAAKVFTALNFQLARKYLAMLK